LEDTEGTLAVRRAYDSAENFKGLEQTRWSCAIRPFVNLALTKNTTDVALAVDAMELACQTEFLSQMAMRLPTSGTRDQPLVTLRYSSVVMPSI
jgi:hypothetical protein